MKYKSRVALLRAAADSIEMQGKAGIEPVCRVTEYEEYSYISDINKLSFRGYVDCDYEFPLAGVEGKPVFVGDELYHEWYGKVKVTGYINSNGEYLYYTLSPGPSASSSIEKFSWNPPESSTVMVELLREDVENIVNPIKKHQWDIITRFEYACRKALEK